MRSDKRRHPWGLVVSRGLIVVLCLSLLDPVPIASRAQSAVSAQSEEAPLRVAVESYFAAYGKKDLAGIVALWSEKSPNLAAYRQNLEQQFTGEDLSFGSPAVSRVKVENERASLRVAIALTSIDLKSRQKSERRLIISFELVKEAGAWKVWRCAPAAEELAEALVKASNKAERAALLAEESELVTVELGRALLTQGQRLFIQSNYDQAKEIYELALEVAERCSDKSTIAGALLGTGNVNGSQGDYAQGLELYQKSLKISEEIGDRPGIARALNNIGNIHQSRSDYPLALELYQKSLKISEEIDDKPGIARTLGNIGVVHRLQGNYPQALEQYQKSFKISEEIGDRSVMASALHNIGLLHWLQGNYALALEQYQKSLKIKGEIGNRAGIGRTLSNIGDTYGAQGNYAQAIEQYQKSLKIKEEIGDKRGIAITLTNIGSVYGSQGNYPQALELYQKSLKIFEGFGDKSITVEILNNIGTVHQLQGNYALALELYQKSLKISEEIGYKAGIAGILSSIGEVHESQGDYTQALEQYQKSLKISEEIGDKLGIAITLNNIGIVYSSQGNYTQGLKFAERASDIAEQIGSRDTLWQAHTVAGRAYLALKQFARARQSFDAAIASIETLRTQVVGGQQEQQRFFESKVDPYQAMVELLVAQNNSGEALVYAERAKARTLFDVLSNGRTSITKAMTDQEIEQERKLKDQLVSFNTQIFQEKQREQADQNRLNQLEAQLQKARLDFEAFQTNLYAAHPELKVRRSEIRPVSLDDATSLIPDTRTALLDFIVTDKSVQLFVLTGESSKPVSLNTYTVEVERKLLAEKVDRFRSRLANKDFDYQRLARELYSLLLKPAEKQLQNRTSLIISPDGMLWDLPFQVLQPREGHYLIEDAAISYAPSLTVLREMQLARRKRQPQTVATSILALGNPELGKQSIDLARSVMMDADLQPLPEAGKQVVELGRMYGKEHSKIYTGPAAREEIVKQESAQYRILHLATHGVLNDASPMYSQVMLAQTPGKSDEDGLLEAWEIMNLNLNADLTVLSACETARGRVGAGEGVIGLTWALFVAGCPATVVSQWKVESSSTTALMVEFHKRFKTRFDDPQSAPSTAEALRQASLHLMKDKQYQHPFFWGGFVVVGDGR